MKSLLAGLMACLVLAVLAVPASAQITGSAHDFTDNLDRADLATTAESWNTSGELCAVCHTPHNGDLAGGDAPLWDRAASLGGFTPYANPATLNATVSAPTGQSLLCLGCHDGTVALDNFAGNPTPDPLTEIDVAYAGDAAVFVDVDLTDDHPVSFSYQEAITNGDTELFPAADVDVAPLLFSGNVECSSCHDVHNNGAGPAAGRPYLLRVDNTGSQLCFTCHNK